MSDEEFLPLWTSNKQGETQKSNSWGIVFLIVVIVVFMYPLPMIPECVYEDIQYKMKCTLHQAAASAYQFLAISIKSIVILWGV